METFNLRHLEMIQGWLKERGSSFPDDSIPPFGLIVENTACGFLIKCDNGWGVLDFFITNPKMEKSARAAALDEIGRGLIQEAKRVGIKYLKCDTQHVSIFKLAKKHGFKSTGNYHSLARGI